MNFTYSIKAFNIITLVLVLVLVLVVMNMLYIFLPSLTNHFNNSTSAIPLIIYNSNNINDNDNIN